MDEVYYDPKNTGSLGGLQRLSKAASIKQAKTVHDWSLNQRTYTLHKPARLRYNTRPYKVAGIDQQWQADLVEMIPYADQNDNFRYLLTIIDLFSRYAWAIPIKDKSGKEVRRAFELVFRAGRIPRRLQTDEGKEFTNREVQQLLNKENIRFFIVKSQFKAAVVERFNRTLKARMWHYFTFKGNYRWINIVQSLVDSYNRSVHRSIGMAPINVNKNNENELWEKQESAGPQNVTQRQPKTKFAVGDTVRISKAKKIFDKGYLPNWTEEMFTISEIINANPTQYKITDYNGDVIDGSFYAAELQKVNKPTLYSIESIIRKRRRGGKLQYFVKWKGYPETFNSWVDNIENINA